MRAAGSTLLAMQMCVDASRIDIALASVSDQDGWRGALTASGTLGGMDAAKGPYLFGLTACPGGGEGIARSSCWRSASGWHRWCFPTASRCLRSNCWSLSAVCQASMQRSTALCSKATGTYSACRALARPPSRDTPQVRPCRLFGGIHAAKGPAMAGTQGPGELAGLRGFQKTPHVLHAMSSPPAEPRRDRCRTKP